MNKAELAELLADKADLTKDKSIEVINTITDEITVAMVRNEAVNLAGFGSFTQRHRKARKGVNPKTGEALDIAASNTVGFKPSKTLKDVFK